MSMPDNGAATESVFGPVVYAYTRAQAMADGVLVDATRLARDVGIRVPVALTRNVWESCIESPGVLGGRDENPRLLVLLWHARLAFVSSGGRSTTLLFVVSGATSSRPAMFRATMGLGDDGQPVLTIMLPDED